jgi:hypothetical protein
VHAKTVGAQARVQTGEGNHQNMEGLHIGCIMGIVFGVDGWGALLFETVVIQHSLLVNTRHEVTTPPDVSIEESSTKFLQNPSKL